MPEVILAKVIKWAFLNGIAITVENRKIEGVNRDAIELQLVKNGKTEFVRFYDWDELDREWLRKLLEEKALNLSSTRLVL